MAILDKSIALNDPKTQVSKAIGRWVMEVLVILQLLQDINEFFGFREYNARSEI